MKALAPSDCQIVVFTPAKTKLQSKLQLCEKACLTLLGEFAEIGWESDLKESEFTEPLNKNQLPHV